MNDYLAYEQIDNELELQHYCKNKYSKQKQTNTARSKTE